MLLSNSNGSTVQKTPPQHQMIRCDKSNNFDNEINNQSFLSSTLPHRNHNKSKGIQTTTTITNNHQRSIKSLQPGNSSTLPTNSTLSSLMAANCHSFGSKFSESPTTLSSNNMNQHYLNKQQELRRQISLNNLDKMINSSSSMTTSNSNKNLSKENSFHLNGKQSPTTTITAPSSSSPTTSKVSLFQQKIRAILLPSSVVKQNNQQRQQTTLPKSGSTNVHFNGKRQNESTYRSYGNLASSTSFHPDIDDVNAVGSLESNIKQEQKNCFHNKSNDDNDCNGNNNNDAPLPSTMQQWQSSSSIANSNLSHHHQQLHHIDSCLLNTLNKYTISASISNNLNNLSSSSTSATLLRPSSELESMVMMNSAAATTESDHYDLRTVCNKLFANKQQYPCVQSNNNINPNGNIHSSSLLAVAATSNSPSSSEVLSSMMQKSSIDTCFRNITPEMNVDKVTRKESLYSFSNNSSSTMMTNMHLHPHDHQNNGVQHSPTQLNVDNDLNGHEAVARCVVVNDTDDNKCPNGLMVRPSNNNGNGDFAKQIMNNHHSQQQQHRQGSTLSLNGGVEPTESVESHDHNYKSSSESGRGTMNSQAEDRNNLDVNSPADLTSLDSDQSNHHIDSDWNKSNNKNNVRRENSTTKSKQNFNKLQRYLEPRSSGKDSELNGTDFRTKLPMNDETDSWTSLSDDLGSMNMNSSVKTKTTLTSTMNKVGVSMPSTMSKHRYHHQTDIKLKTDFSKPENCLNSNLGKQTKASATISGEQQQQQLKPVTKLPPNPHKFITEPIKATKMNTTTNNTLPSYDKCIYSVPDKGKYRNYHQHHYNANEISSATSNHGHHHHPHHGHQQHQKLNEKHNHHQNHCSVVQHGDDDNNDDDVDDCGVTSIISSETNFPDEGCSEYMNDHINNDSNHTRSHLNDPLRKQLKGIEDMYSEVS